MPKTPDVTPAQVLALATFVAGQLVAYGLLSQQREQLVVSIASTAIAAVWKIADAVIRNGRAHAHVSGGPQAATAAPAAATPDAPAAA